MFHDSERRMRDASSFGGLSGQKTAFFKVCTLTLMLIVSGSSFSLRELSSLPVASRAAVSSMAPRSRESRLRVAASPELDTALPELGKNGVYSILNEAQHKALLEANKDKLMIMKVFAPWCRACKGLEPKFNALVKDERYQGLPIVWADLTIQHNKDYVKSIGVLALPTVQFYKHGERVDTFPCGPSKVPILKKKLAAFVNKNVDPSTLQVKLPTQGIVVQPLSGAEAASTTKPAETVEDVLETAKSDLRNIVYFSDMSESEFEAVLSKANLLTFDSGSIIMREGNIGRTFYYILDGDVEICQRTSFEDPLTTPPSYLGTVINRFETGDYFGERALIVGEPRAASIRASTTTKCLAFDQDNFPVSCVLSGHTAKQPSSVEAMDDRYGVALTDIGAASDKVIAESSKASQARGSANSPRPINGVDNDLDEEDDLEVADDIAPGPATVVPASALPDNAEIIVPLLIRFKLIRLVNRCFDYIVKNTRALGDPSVRRRREMLVKLLSPSQRVEFTDAYNLIDIDGDGEITLVELRRLMDSVGEDRSDEELENLIKNTGAGIGKEVITYRDFMGLMAESELYFLFLDTFRSLDKMDTGFVRAKDLDRVLCGIRDLITDDKKSIIDVEDTEMMVDYEQFSIMLLGTSLK